MNGAELEDAPYDWRPGPRPDWVEALHTIADPAWIRLDADELLAEASAKTGLTDFGDGDFLEPYRIFVRALDAEAKLHARGRVIARSDVVNWLEYRLQLAEVPINSPWARVWPSMALSNSSLPIPAASMLTSSA